MEAAAATRAKPLGASCPPHSSSFKATISKASSIIHKASRKNDNTSDMGSDDAPTEPRDRTRDRSRSPTRERPTKKKNLSKGFKFQKKSKLESEEGVDQRQYRDREEEYKPRRFGGKDDRDRFADRNRGRDNEARQDDDLPPTRPPPRQMTDRGPRNKNDEGSKATPKPPKQKPVPSAPATFILVTVNDRLGTKATIPCLPNDTVGDFKKLVAAQIGRQPHEIMLKRQSERPFKDHITLADYGVSNGVQLDLELDTGD